MEKPENHNLFELKNVSKSFGELKVLDDIDLAIETGKTTVVIGPSGCGKTVLLKHLMALIRPDKGTVFFDGERIDNLTEKKLIPMRRRCGFLFQAGALFDSETVAQNVGFPLLQHTIYPQRKIDEMVRERLKLVGLADTESRLPSELSGGQKKRIALARAIALAPEVVLYDEPTTGLDPLRADTINELIIKLQHELKITSIVVTHDMNSAYKIADRIIMLDQGRIIADGTADEIRSSTDATVQRFIRGQSEELNEISINNNQV
ncbi:ABC transporter ATP-binding protein [Planctomycetota bacterium]